MRRSDIYGVDLADALKQQKQALLEPKTQVLLDKVSDRFSGLKVAGLVGDVSACGYYRVINPLTMLRSMGAQVSITTSTDEREIRAADVVICPRQTSESCYSLAQEAMWRGHIVLFEVDDDLHHVLPESPAYLVYNRKSPSLKVLEKFIANTWGLTTTTPEIARWYSQLNKNVGIIDNYIDFSMRDWSAEVSWSGGVPTITPKTPPRPDHWEGKIVIMWSGGTTHGPDLPQLHKPIAHILRKYPETRFAMYSSVEMYHTFLVESGIPKDRTDHIHARHFLDFPGGLPGADIALAPLLPCQFNVSKSYLRILECGAKGSAVVASNVGPYARFRSKHPGTVDLVGESPNSVPTWEEALERLVENPDLLEEKRKNLRELIVSNYSLEHNVHLWPGTWSALAQRAKTGYVGSDYSGHMDQSYATFGRVASGDPCPCGSALPYGDCCRGAWG